MNGSFTAAPGSPTGYIVLRNTVVVTDIPADGTTYTAGNMVGLSAVVSFGSSSSFASTGLLAGTVYHYAVFSYNGSGQSLNYLTTNPLIGNKITLPAVPLAQNVTGQTSNYFKATWAAVPSAIGYELDVSFSTSFAPGSFMEGFNNKNVGNTLEQDLNGLLPDTFYYFRVRAVNASGSSASSNSVSVKTLVGVGGALLTITPPSFPNTLTATISVTVSGGSGAKTVKFYSRKISQNTWNSPVDLTSTTSGYSTTITPALLDELGIEFYFTSQDASTATPKRSPENGNAYIYVPLSANEKSIPNLSFGGQISNYRIISIPYDLENKDVLAVFGALGQYDKTKWRLIQYQNTYSDYPAFTQVAQGRGYWFNAKDQATISLGAGTAPKFGQSSPFVLNLRQGWNLIGDPYPFNIDWDDVLAANNNPVGVTNEYFTFNASTLGYNKTNSLKPFEGGFVLASQNVSLNVPVTLKNSAGGRKQTAQEFANNPDEPNWLVPITLRQGRLENGLTAFGMHTEAQPGKDRFDGVPLPRFLDFVELTTDHREFFIPYFSRDVVKGQENYTWNFTLRTNLNEPVELAWNNKELEKAKAQLLLYDPAAGVLIDMRTTAKYAVTSPDSRELRFIYSRGEGNLPIASQLSSAHPNPFREMVTLPSYFNSDGQPVKALISIRDLRGIEVFRQEIQTNTNGLVSPEWRGEDRQGNAVATGLYLYQVIFSCNEKIFQSAGKIIKH